VYSRLTSQLDHDALSKFVLNSERHRMKVFLSWSGDLSHRIALALREWLPLVIQTLKPYVSSEDIRKGSRWEEDLTRELNESTFGIVCVTRDNFEKPWLNFEAGALFKALSRNKVAPFLVGLRNADLDGPLSQFQATLYEDKDIWQLVQDLNEHSGSVLPPDRLKKLFDTFLPDLKKEIDAAMRDGGLPSTPKANPKDVRERLAEILELVRAQNRQLASLTSQPVQQRSRAGLLAITADGAYEITLPNGSTMTAPDRRAAEAILESHFFLKPDVSSKLLEAILTGPNVEFLPDGNGVTFAIPGHTLSTKGARDARLQYIAGMQRAARTPVPPRDEPT
jgi:TIR domain-containing protein